MTCTLQRPTVTISGPGKYPNLCCSTFFPPLSRNEKYPLNSCHRTLVVIDAILFRRIAHLEQN